MIIDIKNLLDLVCASNGFVSHFKLEAWGFSILIMEKNGTAFGRIYRYDDDTTSIYLDMLSVSEEARMKGIGTKLQEMREEIGRQFGATSSYLWVRKSTWMNSWYQRRGYEYFKEYDQEENSVWMRKSLISNGG